MTAKNDREKCPLSSRLRTTTKPDLASSDFNRRPSLARYRLRTDRSGCTGRTDVKVPIDLYHRSTAREVYPV